MVTFLKIIWKEKILIGFLLAALLIFVVSAVGTWGVLSISKSFERIEKDVIRQVSTLEEMRGSLSLMLLDLTTFLLFELPSPEAAEKQISGIREYEQRFKNGLAFYGEQIGPLEAARSVLYPSKDQVLSLVETILTKKKEGIAIEKILPYKKELKELEAEIIFPEIQKNIIATLERLVTERARNKSFVQMVFVVILLSGAISIILVLFLGFRIIKKEKLVDQFREQLISLASHQLKAPITIIKGYAELLLDSKTLSGQDRENAEIVKDTAQNMNLLIRDLLDLSQMDQGKFIIEKKPVELGSLIKNIIEFLRPLAEKSKVTMNLMKPENPISILTDKLHIQQALQNIIENGIKYSRIGGSLSITLEEKDAQVLLVIRDSGIGIPKKEADMIFKRFYRASNASKHALSGTGLGLFIAREVVRQSGGEISFESKEEEGTAFFIQLPITKITASV